MMSVMSRFGPAVAKGLMVQQQRQMAVAAQSDPIQRLFLDKIKEFKSTSKGLDDRHQKMMDAEMNRLRNAYSVDENKLTTVDTKFPTEAHVTLHDLETNKQFRERVYSGEHQRQLVAASKTKSELLDSIDAFAGDKFHLPSPGKPDERIIFAAQADVKIPPPQIVGRVADINANMDPVTPESLGREMRVYFGENMPTIDDDKSPQRDLVNFPRIPVRKDTPPSRYHILPDSWFQFFYPKTGVSGPYVFTASFGTFLLSKEWLVMEHEIISNLALVFVFSWAITKFGPGVSGYFKKSLDNEINQWDNWQQGSIKHFEQVKEHYSRELMNGSGIIDELYDARRQDLEQQAEREYRARVKKVYDETKKRLNYLVAVADSRRQIHQTHMVDWVISNVRASIGPKQEEDYLSSCIGNLKQLAQKNSNII